MNDKTVALLKTLADKLGTTSTYLWHVLINQAKIVAYTDIFYLAICLIAIFASFKTWIYVSKKGENGYSKADDWDIPELFYIFLGICSIISFVFAICLVQEIIVCLINPEYFALNQIIKNL